MECFNMVNCTKNLEKTGKSKASEERGGGFWEMFAKGVEGKKRQKSNIALQRQSFFKNLVAKLAQMSGKFHLCHSFGKASLLD